MKKTLALVLAGVMAFSMVGCASAASGTTAAAEASGQQPAANIQDPDLFKTMETTDLEGNAVDSSVFTENKLTLVNVWNIGCTPCIQELATLDKLNKEYEGQGVAIRGLYNNFSTEIGEEERAEIAQVLDAEGAEYPHWLVSQAMLDTKTFEEWSFFPGTFLVDAEGNILDMLEGARDYEGWKSVIDNALQQVEANA